MTKDILQITFNCLDVDMNGQITIEEIQKAFEAGGTTHTKKFW